LFERSSCALNCLPIPEQKLRAIFFCLFRLLLPPCYHFFGRILAFPDISPQAKRIGRGNAVTQSISRRANKAVNISHMSADIRAASGRSFRRG
jgi:hypothetical protein